MRWRFWRAPLSAKKIAKLAALAANPFAQPEVRVQKMERLLEEGSAAALLGVLQRFAANAQGQIADEEEKAWLVGALVDKGDAAVAPLEAYIRAEAKLSHALGAYAKLVGNARAATFFAARLEALGPDDHRSVEAKQQLLAAFVERASPGEILVKLVPFLEDHSDDVRWQVLETIDRAAQASKNVTGDGAASPTLTPAALSVVRPHLVAQVTPGPTSARIARRAARLLCAQKWPWLDPGAQLAASVAAHHRIDAEGRLEALDS